MSRHGLSELELEGEGRKIRLRKPEPQQLAPTLHFQPPALAALPVEQQGGIPAPLVKEAAGKGTNLREVTSPMVGTFYRAQSPEADPFVQEGDRVEEGTVLCLIEAM